MDRLLQKAFGTVLVALLLGPLGFTAAAQTNLAGTVVSGTGEPLAGVQLSLPSLQMGTLTNTDGRYVIQNVPNGAQILRAELIGYESLQRRVEVTGTTVTENFTLTETAVEMDGLVVTALGISRSERALGYAVQDIQGDDIAGAGVSTNLVTALSGKVSGVLIKNQGAMGGRSDITIRGLASIAGNNQPLFVVDGVPIDNTTDFSANSNAIQRVDYGNAAQDLNPDDIESISVLKGANAAALYGSRASNGVILITTKKGAGADGRLEITASAEASFATASISPRWQNVFGGGDRTSTYEYADGAGGGVGDYIDESWGPAMNGQLYNQWTADPADADGIALRPWMPVPYSTRDLFETGINTTEHFSVAGSSGAVNGRLSATQVNADGQSPYHEIDRTQLSIAGGVTPIEALRVQGSASYMKSGGKNRPLNDGGSLNSATYQYLWWQRSTETQMAKRAYDLWLEKGSEFGPDHPGYGLPRNWNHNYWDNIYFVLAEAGNKDTRDRFIGNVDVDYAFTDNVSISARVGTDWYEHRRKNVFPKFSHDYKFGAFIDQTIFRQETNADIVLTAQGDLNDDFNLSVRGGVNRRANDTNRHSIETENLIISGLYTPQNSAVPPTVDNWLTEKRVYSAYGLGSLSYRNYAFVDVTARNDWSSSLPKGNNSYFYPSVSAALVLSDAFQWDGGVFDYAKVRASWAQVGSDADPYKTSAVMTQLQTFQGSPGFIPSNNLPATNLRPEITTSWEVGADVRFADNRMTLDATYYSTRTRDQILSVPISTTSGYSAQIINAGEVKNSGVEMLLTTDILRGSGLQWNMTLNWARNRSEVLALHESLDRIVLGSYSVTYEARVGEAYGTVYGDDYKRDAKGVPIIDSKGYPQRSATKQPLCPGGESSICIGDERATSEPDWIGGIRNDFRFGLVQLSFLMDVRWGGVMYCGTCRLGVRDGLLYETGYYGGRVDGVSVDDELNFSNRRSDVVGVNMLGVTESGEPNMVYAQAKNFWGKYDDQETPWVERATFGKLREVKLSFDLTPNVLEKLPFSTGRMTLVGRNLAIFCGSRACQNIDPESDGNAFADNHGRGVEYLSAPSDRTFGVNFTVTR
jgi:TonB-linked SusC/RagA family outer membrane protein